MEQVLQTFLLQIPRPMFHCQPKETSGLGCAVVNPSFTRRGKKVGSSGLKWVRDLPSKHGLYHLDKNSPTMSLPLILIEKPCQKNLLAKNSMADLVKKQACSSDGARNQAEMTCFAREKRARFQSPGGAVEVHAQQEPSSMEQLLEFLLCP
ncbi:hypothetical protein SAY87_017768 [Trapa incisa]|uniref:Uncharacterized protein n=1 Tax=Trapa incisa TaxID=236973 RepID=A0AAN7L278_9MYRT|nr:hypothetical protein SAY87_017768 [Trapa incisa]